MFHSHSLNRYGNTFFRSMEYFSGAGVQNGEESAFIEVHDLNSEISTEELNGTREGVDPEDDSDLLPSELAESEERPIGLSEHGTLISGEASDLEELRNTLRDLLG
jgi:hypothetical protein